MIKLTTTSFTATVTNHNLIILLCLEAMMFLVTAQWLSGRVLDSGPRGGRFEPHRRHCVVVLGQNTFILA